MLKKPRPEPFPFHARIDVFNASLEAVTAVSGIHSPPFNLESDPRRVFEHVRDSIICYGDERRHEGRCLEREGVKPSVDPKVVLEAFKLMQKLNSFLS